MAESIRKILCHMPSFQDEQYYYMHDRRLLVLQTSLPQEELRLFLFISRTTEDEIDGLVQKVKPVRLALSYFLRSQIDLDQEVRRVTDQILTKAFASTQYRLEDLLHQNGIDLDAAQAYRVMLVDFEDQSISDMEVDFTGSLLQLAHRYADAILCPLTWQGRGLVIMPDVDSNLEPALRDHTAGMQQMLQDWQQDFSKRHQVQVDCGLGSVHKLPELQRSYQEARMTLSYGRTKHEHGFFRYYEDCGILSNIFAGGVESAFAFCRSALGRLLEYDGENEGDLLATLKLLLETNFNYSATAAELFVHANTVRYRSDKIEQLLMRDLSDPDVRFNLYAAVRVQEILVDMHILPDGYVGKVHEKVHGSEAAVNH
ncbi:PucR family transcriptional regulator [Mitsuokella multacida]|uniref:PucR family transcriptional regulator n=1 Tax=Mitsuokella multacida TaxID=52226 RepID=A0A414NW69_9FIRM|nr:PucR family transcriptional regulator [Mitsuokella multacida]